MLTSQNSAVRHLRYLSDKLVDKIIKILEFIIRTFSKNDEFQKKKIPEILTIL